jgi:hypothetical protein
MKRRGRTPKQHTGAKQKEKQEQRWHLQQLRLRNQPMLVQRAPPMACAHEKSWVRACVRMHHIRNTNFDCKLDIQRQPGGFRRRSDRDRRVDRRCCRHQNCLTKLEPSSLPHPYQPSRSLPRPKLPQRPVQYSQEQWHNRMRIGKHVNVHRVRTKTRFQTHKDI